MSGIFQSVLSLNISLFSFLACIITSIVIGAAISVTYMKTSKRYTNSFVVTLALLPSVVMVVIMMVNGNLGAGVAVAGAFSRVRFSSLPGTAKEIGAIFIALGVGLSTGMGFLTFSIIYTAVMLLVLFAYNKVGFGERRTVKKLLTIVIPESLNYSEVFDDIFRKYTSGYELVNVKTTNMGSLFKITYEIELKNQAKEKEMIDEIRCRNSNLEISCGRLTDGAESL